jgi:hypothetical protein
MNERIKEVLDSILGRFKSGDIPEAVAYSMFPIADIPSAKWSILNRIIMFIAGTQDARGFRQWHEVNRYVKKGSKGFYILVPHIRKEEDKETGTEKQVLVGFLTRSVFRYEDTDGKPIIHEEAELANLPLIERAEEWGISVAAIPGGYRYSGYYSQSKKLIALATKEECEFFHELAHCAHEKILGKLKKGQDPAQEIVAELASQALCRIAGKSGDRHLGNSYRYIESYAVTLAITPHAACLKVMHETEMVLTLILKGETEARETPQTLAA